MACSTHELTRTMWENNGKTIPKIHLDFSSVSKDNAFWASKCTDMLQTRDCSTKWNGWSGNISVFWKSKKEAVGLSVLAAGFCTTGLISLAKSALALTLSAWRVRVWILSATSFNFLPHNLKFQTSVYSKSNLLYDKCKCYHAVYFWSLRNLLCDTRFFCISKQLPLIQGQKTSSFGHAGKVNVMLAVQ